MLPVGEFDMALPCPCVGVAVFTDCCDDGLVTVRIGDFVPGSFLIIIAHSSHSSALRAFKQTRLTEVRIPEKAATPKIDPFDPAHGERGRT